MVYMNAFATLCGIDSNACRVKLDGPLELKVAVLDRVIWLQTCITGMRRGSSVSMRPA